MTPRHNPQVVGAAICAWLETRPNGYATIREARQALGVSVQEAISGVEAAKREGMLERRGIGFALTAAGRAALAEGREELDADNPVGLA